MRLGRPPAPQACRPSPATSEGGEVAAEEDRRRSFGSEGGDDRRAVSIFLEAEQPVTLADQEEHDRGERHPDPAEREELAERSVAAGGKKQQSRNDDRAREVEGEQESDRGNHAVVHGEELI